MLNSNSLYQITSAKYQLRIRKEIISFLYNNNLSIDDDFESNCFLKDNIHNFNSSNSSFYIISWNYSSVLEFDFVVDYLCIVFYESKTNTIRFVKNINLCSKSPEFYHSSNWYLNDESFDYSLYSSLKCKLDCSDDPFVMVHYLDKVQ